MAISYDCDGSAGAMSYVDALVPVSPDASDLLERIRSLGIADGRQPVVPGPLDEATLNLVRRVLTATDRNLLLELPRGRQDVAVLLGAYLQLMRLVARRQGHFSREGFDGAVVAIGLNTNLTERLRAIKVERVSLSDALCALRVRADGGVVDLRGQVMPANARRDSLLYLNTSLGWPVLQGVKVGVAVIDRTSFRNADTLGRALAWAERHEAERVVVVGNLGEPPQPPLTEATRWIRWSWTPALLNDLAYELGDGPVCGPLSTNPLLHVLPQPVGAVLYMAPELSDARRTCLRGIAAARRVNQPFPGSIAAAVQLVNRLGGLWGSVATANTWAAMEPRGTTSASLARTLRQAHGEDLRGRWEVFRETNWAELRASALRMTDLLTDYNPRLDVLLSVLDWAASNRPGAIVTVRTPSRSSAAALAHDLVDARPALASDLEAPDGAGSPRLAVIPYSDRNAWASEPHLDVHLGVPAPWRRAALLSGEASEHIVVVDQDEHRWLTTVLAATDDDFTARMAAGAQTLGLAALPTPNVPTARVVMGPLDIDSRGTDSVDVAIPGALPGVDLDQLFAAFSSAISQVDNGEDDAQREAVTTSGGRSTLARMLTLEPDGAMYWVPSDTRLEILSGTKYSSVLTSDLTAGMRVLIPRGESRDELYQRLLQAAHRDADVMAVQMMLRRFRVAMRELHDKYGSWTDVARELRHYGSRVETGSTCAAWANGDVIAPEDVHDIRRVGRLTYGKDLLVDRTWERLGAIADQLRQMHRSLGRLLSAALGEVASGNPGPCLSQLSAACGGIDTAEILEEFEVRQVRSVSAPASVPSTQLRRVLGPADSR